MYSCGSSNINNTFLPCDYFRTIGTSVSRWCSNGSGACGDPAQGCCAMPFYAYLTQTAAFAIAANAPIPFTGANLIGDCIELEDGRLLLPCAGVYMVNYRVHLPVTSTVDTSFVVRVDGVDIAGTQQSAIHTAGLPAATVSAQAIFAVSESAAVGLYTTNALSLPISQSSEALATMTVIAL